MQISTLTHSDGLISVSAAGKITQSEVSPFREPLGDELGSACYSRTVLLNLHDVTMIDSSGVSWLLVCQKRFRNAGGQLILHSMSPIVSNVLKVLNMHTVFKMADNEQHALEMLKGSAP